MKKLLVLLFASTTVSLLAQTPAQGPTFRTGVDVIAVDVAVVDAQGRPVADLLAPDFDVKIDGQPRRVVSLQLVRADPARAKRLAEEAPEPLYSTNISQPTGRMIVIAVDQMNIPVGNVRPVLSAASRFLDGLSPVDRVAFFAYPAPGASVDFTTDHARIRKAMELTVGSQLELNLSKFNIGMYEAYQISEKHDDVMFQNVLARECGRLTGTALEECARQLISDTETIITHTRMDTSASLAGLRSLLRYLGTIEGPKSLILLSEGLVLDSPADLDDTIRLADVGRVTVNVLLMDAPRIDIAQASLRPTATEDRAMRVSGLEDLAAHSRGGLFRVIGTGEAIFDRLTSELSAYYLLGVEQAVNDRNDRSHRIDVDVRRRGVTIRSRRAFVLASAANAIRKPEQSLADTLRSPIGVPDLPLRMTTFVSQSTGSAKVDILLAAEVGQPGAAAADFTIGYLLIDAAGKVTANSGERVKLSPVPGSAGAPLQYLAQMQADPGTYSLRFGVVDTAGRRGSVVRELNAWQMDGQPFAVGDLMVGAIPPVGRRMMPSVEPHVEGNVLAFVDLYASAAASFDTTTVKFEIADGPDSAALLAVPAQIGPGRQTASRVAGGIVQATILPPGHYVVRAHITRDGKPSGVLVRPFILEPAPAAAAAAGAGAASPVLPVTITLGSVARFDRNAVLSSELLTSTLDAVEKRSPALKSAVAAARSAKYSGAAVEALAAGDQTVAAFLKGLDWYAKGQLEQAANQLGIAAGPRREFFPAALYLGASFAAAGQDRDAAAVWQLGIGSEPRPSAVYAFFADARLRAGQPESVIDVLRPAYERTPMDDEIGRRLAAAYLLIGRLADAVPVLDGYLTRHPADPDALFAAVAARYNLTTAAGGAALPEADRARIARYAQAYRGPYRALVDKYVAAMRPQ